MCGTSKEAVLCKDTRYFTCVTVFSSVLRYCFIHKAQAASNAPCFLTPYIQQTFVSKIINTAFIKIVAAANIRIVPNKFFVAFLENYCIIKIWKMNIL